ncbi:MAG: hypothetical protein GX749_04975 [Ruminococcaceae bacterium]|nr:hypothetical protein [Oscillospiraceae bacterium]
MAFKPRKRLLLWLLIIIVFLTLAGLLTAHFLRRSAPAEIRFASSFPGSATPGYTHSGSEEIERLSTRTSTLLLTGRGWLRSLRIEGPQTGQPAEPALVLDAMDHMAAARVALESADLIKLQTELSRIRNTFVNQEGLVAAEALIESTGSADRSEGFANAPTLAWLRLLAESYQLTDSPELLQELRITSDNFLARTGPDGLLPADTQLILYQQPPPRDPEVTPTPKPTQEPTPTIESIRQVIQIADIDLYTMQLLQPLDERWQLVLNRNRTVLEAATLAGTIPLFQYAYDPAIADYIGFTGTQPLVETEAVLRALLHIYEAGAQLPQTLTYLRNRFYESSVLPEQIDRVTGAASESECITGYALLARIARITTDAALYERAATRLLWHTATNTRSEAYGAVFRTDPDNRIRVTARDNLLALLALN